MSILYNEQDKTITLNTKNTSYQMKIGPCDLLVHTYYGPTAQGDMSYCLAFRDRGFSGNPYDAGMDRTISADTLPLEYPCEGSGDYRATAFSIRRPNGAVGCDLRYVDHTILPGKYSLPGLPAVYAEQEAAETLLVTLKGESAGVTVQLQYGVIPELDVITRAARIGNSGSEAITLQNAASAALDIVSGDWELMHFCGRHAGERAVERTEIGQREILIGSRRGTSSHQENPFVISGQCMGVSFLYSGSFACNVSRDSFGTTRAVMGVQPEHFDYPLAPGEWFQTPEAALVYSAQGLACLSQRFHRMIADHVCRGPWKNRRRPVLINNWEATGMRFDGEKILSIARKASELGVEMMVLDDGWFGKRNDDNCSLGDWVVNREKLPNGLKGLAERVNALGLKFGLWFEPEMVSPDSDLYRKHPDWCIHTPGRSRTVGRNQLILDLSRDEVCDYIVKTLSGILESANIAYVKWDMNRNMTEVPGPEQPHRYMLGLYRVLETLTSRFPNVLFEGCSGGGGRFDAGMLCYMPQIWTSDDTDGVERLPIQEGTSLFYPLGTMGAHVSAVPNHQVGRVTPLSFRGAVASLGRYGLELDLSKLSQEELEEISRQIRFYRQYEQVIHGGNLYRLESVSGGKRAAYEIISEDGKTVLVFDFCVTGTPNSAPGRLRLQALEEEADYRDETGQSFPGGTLMHVGIPTDTRRDMTARIRVFERLDG